MQLSINLKTRVFALGVLGAYSFMSKPKPELKIHENSLIPEAKPSFPDCGASLGNVKLQAKDWLGDLETWAVCMQ